MAGDPHHRIAPDRPERAPQPGKVDRPVKTSPGPNVCGWAVPKKLPAVHPVGPKGWLAMFTPMQPPPVSPQAEALGHQIDDVAQGLIEIVGSRHDLGDIC